MAFVEEMVLDGGAVLRFFDDFIVAEDQASEILRGITQNAAASLIAKEDEDKDKKSK